MKKYVSLVLLISLFVTIAACVPTLAPTVTKSPDRTAIVAAAQTTIASYAPTPSIEEQKDLPKCGLRFSPIPTVTPQPTPRPTIKSVVASIYKATYKCIDQGRVQTLIRGDTIYTFEGFQPDSLCPRDNVYSTDQLGPFKLIKCEVISTFRKDVKPK